jgi:hypothetical protein
MAGGIGTGYGALDFLMAGGGTSQAFGVNPYSTSSSIMGLPSSLFGGSGSSYSTSAPGYLSTVTTGSNSGSGYLTSDQAHLSSQSANAVLDGQTTNNLYTNQNDQQKVNVYLDPQIGPGRSGTNMLLGGILSNLGSVSTGGQIATTEAKNNQKIGLDQSAYAEEGGTAINNAYQIQNNVQIINLYLDLNIQLPGMPQNPWMSSPWLPSGLTNATGTTYSPYTTTGSGTNTSVTSSTGSALATSQYDPEHVQPFKDFVLATTDMDYTSRSALRETIKEYATFFTENGSPSLSRAFMTLAGAVGSGANLDRAERRFLRFEDAVLSLDETEKAYLQDALNILADEVSESIEGADSDIIEDIQYSLQDLGRAITGYDYEDLGYDDAAAEQAA